MREKQICPHCGQPMMKHTHCFSKALSNIIVTTMKKFPVKQAFHLQNDLALTKNQYNNFQKLRYWELVRKHYADGRREGGYWELTEKARDLINGGLIPRQVVTFNNEVCGYGDDHISLKDAYGYYDIPEVWARRATPVTEEEDLFNG